MSSAMLVRDAEDVFAGELPTHVRNRVKPLVGMNGFTGKPYRKGMEQVCRAHSAKTEADQERRVRELAAAEAFYADTTSKWCRILTMNERGKR